MASLSTSSMTSFAEIVDLFPRTEQMRRLSRMRTRYAQLCLDVQQPDIPHRPVRRGTANERERNATRQKVPSSYHNQVKWQESLKAMQWDRMPSCDKLPSIPNPNLGDWRCPALFACGPPIFGAATRRRSTLALAALCFSSWCALCDPFYGHCGVTLVWRLVAFLPVLAQVGAML